MPINSQYQYDRNTHYITYSPNQHYIHYFRHRESHYSDYTNLNDKMDFNKKRLDPGECSGAEPQRLTNWHEPDFLEVDRKLSVVEVRIGVGQTG